MSTVTAEDTSSCGNDLLDSGSSSSGARDLAQAASAGGGKFEKLLIMAVGAAECASFISGLDYGLVPPGRKRNQNLPPLRRSCQDSDLKFPQTLPVGGHCQYLVTRKTVKGAIVETIKLSEGGSNNDSPRVANFPGLKSDVKVYVYHAVALGKAYSDPNDQINIATLAQVSQSKSEANARTILHLCGHKWCVNANHLYIGSKVLNDEQIHCHRGLQSASNSDELHGVQKFYCRHITKCWSIVYEGVFADSFGWAAS